CLSAAWHRVDRRGHGDGSRIRQHVQVWHADLRDGFRLSRRNVPVCSVWHQRSFGWFSYARIRTRDLDASKQGWPQCGNDDKRGPGDNSGMTIPSASVDYSASFPSTKLSIARAVSWRSAVLVALGAVLLVLVSLGPMTVELGPTMIFVWTFTAII